jgi:uroporphyrinogen III methyltransferase / synthase
VHLVGAGPGAPGLLTLRGAEVLGSAAVLVHDPAVPAEMLRLAPANAEVKCAANRAADLALMVARAREGRQVVRLVSGDACLDGRAAEEAEQLAEAGVRLEIVPGISQALAAPIFAGIPLVHPRHGTSVAIATADAATGAEQAAAALKALAHLPGTKVIMPGPQPSSATAKAMIAGGASPETPACTIRQGATNCQQVTPTTLGVLAAQPAGAEAAAPAVLVAGSVTQLRTKLNWFETRPLFGQQIVVTRTREQAGGLGSRLREEGAEVLEVPTIRIVPPDHKEPLCEALSALNEYDWLIFTSVNGVASFFDYFFRVFHDLRDLGGVRIAAVGPATARRLRELHLTVDAMPEEALGREVAHAMAEQGSLENLRVCLLRAEQASRELPQLLEDKGAIVDDIACYKTVPEMEDGQVAAAQLLARGAHWITFTSGSTVQNFHSRFDLPALLKKFTGLRTASIGPETSKALAALGLAPATEAREHTLEGLVKALEKAVR